MPKSCVAAHALVLFACAAAAAEPPIPGSRVRIERTGQVDLWSKGQVLAVSADTLTVRWDKDAGNREPLAAWQIRRLQVSSGRRGHVVTGMLVGAGAGLLTGVIGNASQDSSPDDWDLGPDDEYVVLLTTLAGTVLGGVVGLLVRTEKWQDAGLPAVSTAGPGRVGLAVRW